jgi:hypothetical protein
VEQFRQLLESRGLWRKQDHGAGLGAAAGPARALESAARPVFVAVRGSASSHTMAAVLAGKVVDGRTAREAWQGSRAPAQCATRRGQGCGRGAGRVAG